MDVILHNLRSSHNVGSIFRTADAMGIKKIYLCGITPEPVNRLGKPRIHLTKVSLGAEKNVSWEKCKSTSILIKKIKKDGYKIFAVEQSKKSIPLGRLQASDLKPKIAIVLGSEVGGLPDSILSKSDKIIEILMKGKKESLNVSVTFGIVSFFLNTLKEGNEN